MQRRLLYLLVVGASLGTGCGVFTGVDCTLIGCQDGLEVILESHTAAGPVHVMIELPDGSTLEQRCPRASGCPTAFFFADVQAPAVTVYVTVGAGPTRSAVIHPEYETHQPNGPECGPICRVATVGLSDADLSSIPRRRNQAA